MGAFGNLVSLFHLTKKLPTAPIRIYLLIATSIAIIPLIILSIVLLSRLEAGRQQNTISRSKLDANFIARNVDGRIAEMDTMLRLLSSLPELKRRDYTGFKAIVDDALAGVDFHSVVLSTRGTKLIDTSLNADLIPFFATISTELSRSLRNNENILRGFTFDSMTRSWSYYTGLILNTAPPALPNVLMLVKTEKALKDHLLSDILYSGWSVALLDENATIITSSQKEGLPGNNGKLTPSLMRELNNESGIAIVDSTVYIRSSIPSKPWSIVVWGPLKPKVNIVSQAFTYLALGSLAIITLTATAGYLTNKYLRRAVRALSDMATEVGEGKVVPPVETHITELDQVARTLTTASYDRHLAQEKSEIISQELIHRSKNTITLLQAIMRQLSKEATSVEAYHKALDQRLRGFAKSMSELAVVEWSGVELSKFVSSHLSVFGDLSLRVDASGPNIRILPTAAQNLGLIIHELMTNSIKHGALSEDIGTATIRWSLVDGSDDDSEQRFVMTWRDDTSHEVKPKSASGFGSTIIERHAEYSFSGSVQIESTDQKFYWKLTCPARNVVDVRQSINL